MRVRVDDLVGTAVALVVVGVWETFCGASLV